MESLEHHRLLSAAENYKADLLAFLQDLVRIPSVNGRNTEKKVAERILREAQRWGLPAHLAAKNVERPNALVTLGRGDKRFALIGHMDTVAEGKPEDWTYPPFSASVKNGMLFGRGAADNKAGIACGFYTLVLLQKEGLLDPEHYQVVLAGVVDEESGASSDLGVRYLLDSNQLRADGAIYTYTSNFICIGHRGLLRIEIETHGTSFHAGLVEWNNQRLGDNAVTGLAEILLELEKLRLPFPQKEGFEQLGCTITPGTQISGGDYPSIVPNHAAAIVDIRLMPGQDAGEVLQAIDEVMNKVCQRRSGLKAEKKVMVNFPGAAISPSHPLVTTAQDITEIYTGKRWEAKGAGPGNEGYMLIGAGIPTLCGFGPNGGNPHAPDEWVEIESLARTTAMYAAILCKYLTI